MVPQPQVMQGTAPQAQHQSLAQQLNRDFRPFAIGNVTYNLYPLSPGDIASLGPWMRSRRMAEYISTTRGINISLSARGQTESEIMKWTPNEDDVIATYEGQIYILYLSLKKREQSAQIAPLFVTFLDQISNIALDDLNSAVMHILEITGLWKKSDGGSQGYVPLDQTKNPTQYGSVSGSTKSEPGSFEQPLVMGANG